MNTTRIFFQNVEFDILLDISIHNDRLNWSTLNDINSFLAEDERVLTVFLEGMFK